MSSSAEPAVGTKRPMQESKHLESGFWLYMAMHRDAISKELGSEDNVRIAKEAYERWAAAPVKETLQLKVTALAIESALAGSKAVAAAAAAATDESAAEEEQAPPAKKAKAAKVEACPPEKKKTSAFSIYVKESRAAIEADIGKVSYILVSQEAGKRWKALSAEERAPFEAMAASEDPPAKKGSAPGGGAAAKTSAKPAATSAEALLSDEDVPLLAFASAVTKDKPDTSKKEAKVKSPESTARAPKEAARPVKAEAQRAATEEAKEKSRKSSGGASKAIKYQQATKEFKAQVLVLVRAYIEKDPNWSKSTLQNDLAEEHGWEYDKYLDLAIREALKACGFEGLGAGVSRRMQP